MNDKDVQDIADYIIKALGHEPPPEEFSPRPWTTRSDERFYRKIDSYKYCSLFYDEKKGDYCMWIVHFTPHMGSMYSNKYRIDSTLSKEDNVALCRMSDL